MLHSRRIRFGRLASALANGAQQSLVVLLLAAALVCTGSFSQPARTLTMSMGAANVAFADTDAASGASSSAPTAHITSSAAADRAADTESAWGAEDWREWERQVQRVAAPTDITAGEPLRVTVRAVGPDGQSLADADVEITWVCPNGQFQDICTTGPFGEASVTRTLGASCRGKRCLVAVVVSQSGMQGYAYSAFAPK